MNCEEARQNIMIKDVLEHYNLFPSKENRKTAFYFALDRDEKTPSLSVDFVKNRAFDFGTGKSYDVISIVQQINQCSVSDALKYLEKYEFSSCDKMRNLIADEEMQYKILKVNNIQHFALIDYLESRKVSAQKHLVKEINYETNGKRFFGLGFFNDSGGVEIRNKYSKICLGKKDVTLIKNQQNTFNEIAVFEGFFDYLTFKNISREQNLDFLILNSTSMLFKVEKELKKYRKISLFLDNDANGQLVKSKIANQYNNVEDCSHIYLGYKDLSEWYCRD
ncbi:DNA primase [Chryseobacterium indologenes]|uniref:Toprim domain-containing protein n=2 Tax=Chryseobacterium group TaxID=2782232 RepID=A0ABY4BKA4_9FLAO|nr:MULTISPECIES: toprim domain-containing protein [Chryseobacterium]UEQ79073.1 toprim domain-containing protein [Chryseobacterium arthrosphaerae]UOE39604.1 toprim domain-containing protein [Chryseobacterium oryzae]VXC34527.1 DNA primase [Chryseobacterium sp. 8AT]AYZ38119.1 DNA primase [Chryseobacterium indologenes]MEB4761455.1 toprim domain-containing protein [Chryseobacterium indologenes]